LAAERLGDALRVPWVRVDAHDGTVAEVGHRPSWSEDHLVHRTELVHLGVEQGTVLLAPRSPAEPLDSRDRALLAPLTSMVAAVLASRRLVADLQRSREDVVLGREEERRRLRRDLHDGVGPLLSALSSHADVALLRTERDPRSVAELLVKIRAICDDAVSGLRHVVEDLQPAAVDELGLVGALDELVATMAGEAVTIELTGEPDGDLPAAVEVAAFRITAEALHNAIRHARPRRVGIHVSTGPTGLVLRIQDDGSGIASDARPGVGLASMRQRAEELGGTLDVESSSHGTLVRATLPVRR
jgi:signal transduction histidine kinase